VSLHETCSPTWDASSQPTHAPLLYTVLQRTQRPILPKLSQLQISQEKLSRALLAANLQPRLSVEVFDPAHSYNRNISILLLRITTLRLRLACACLAWLRSPTCTSENLEQKLPLFEPLCQRTPCGRFNCTPCKNYRVQDRETIESNSLFSQTSIQP
jgi:hypothetical protein